MTEPVEAPAPEAPKAWNVWTVPNAITAVRLLCLPIFVVLLFGHDNRAAAAWLLAFLGMTDWCDGYIARHFDQVSELGKILDPVADRMLFFVGLTCIMIDSSMPIAIGIAILAREVVVGVTTVILGLLGARRIDVTWFGKAGTFANMVAVPSFLGSHSTLSYAPVLGALAWVAVVPGLALSYYAALLYIPIAKRALAEGRAARAGAPG